MFRFLPRRPRGAGVGRWALGVYGGSTAKTPRTPRPDSGLGAGSSPVHPFTRSPVLPLLLAELLLVPALASWGQGAPGYVPGRLLVQFKAGVGVEHVRAAVAEMKAQDTGEIPHTGVHILQLPEQASEVALQHAFANRPDVNFAELDIAMQPAQAASVTPNDTLYPIQWHLPRIACPTAWATTTGSASMVIAIVDTGCDPTHPDLVAKYVPGWNLYDNNSNTADVYSHGTTVAGAAAAASNNGSGVASVAWGCMIMPVRISDTTGWANYSMAAAGITWAADHGARVVNLSYGMSDSSTVTSAAKYLQAKGGVLTVGAGNSGTFDATADNPYLLTVSATDSNDAIASWSNYGNNVDVAAPGVNLALPINGGIYGSGSGTSFSAPLVAGVVALMMSVNPSLTPSQVQSVIESSADLVGGAAGWTPQYGWGRLNAARAVQMAAGTSSPPPPTVSIANPAAGSTVAATVSVQASASSSVGVSSVTVFVDGTQVASSSGSACTYSWNTTSASNGAHTLKAHAVDQLGNAADTQNTVTVSNASDTTPPVASIASPANGAKAGSTLTVSVTASDNIGVVKVALYVDGKLFAADAACPWAFSISTKKWSSGSSHTLQAYAYDAAGNVGASAVVTVSK